ncbi:MAG: cell division protein FtsL [Proteobacteria bacterium]|nr:cell division protein FtsL [Pseudomonadota bacterium]
MKTNSKQTQRGSTLVWVFFLVVLTAELFVFTWSRVQCTATGYALTHQQDEHKRLLSLEKKLRIERAHLMSPDRIAAFAAQKIGLQMPEQNQILTIR